MDGPGAGSSCPAVPLPHTGPSAPCYAGRHRGGWESGYGPRLPTRPHEPARLGTSSGEEGWGREQRSPAAGSTLSPKQEQFCQGASRRSGVTAGAIPRLPAPPPHEPGSVRLFEPRGGGPESGTRAPAAGSTLKPRSDSLNGGTPGRGQGGGFATRLDPRLTKDKKFGIIN